MPDHSNPDHSISSSKPSAHFITVDGIDGVGKSTQIRHLVDWLQKRGHETLATRDPGSTEIGARLREILLESSLTMHRRTEAMLFMASRCEMVETLIRPNLGKGVTIVSDRFLLANVVYQSVGKEDEQQVADELWQLGEMANARLRPELTLLLDMPAVDAMNRINRPADRMESRGVEYMESVRQAFLRELPRSSEHVAVINANQTPAEVTAELIAATENYLSSSM